jgi:hypothetical protein
MKITDNFAYTACVEFEHEPADTDCACDNCDWKGKADQLEEIVSCVLSPGEEAPAGRCPACGALAYVIKPDAS